MPTIGESIGQQPSNPITGSGGIYDALAAGVDVLGQREQVAFVPYVRTVMPLDGFVFWLNANLLTSIQLAAHGIPSAAAVNVMGSLHYATTAVQVADETIAVKAVDFTSEVEVEAFGALDNDTMYVGTWQTALGPFQFTFSRRNPFYVQAGISHYVGDAIYPAFASQLIDTLDGFDQRQVVSNSLPLWLAMVQSPPVFSDISLPLSVLYPAFLVPDNLLPAYGAVEIPPGSTRALQSVAWRDRDSTRYQLTAERVRITTYGLRNDEVTDLIDYTVDYCRNVGTFGLMSTPIVHDEHRPQVELAALAQKKTVEFEVSYSQYRARDIARQLIQGVVVGVTASDQAAIPEGSPLLPLVFEPKFVVAPPTLPSVLPVPSQIFFPPGQLSQQPMIFTTRPFALPQPSQVPFSPGAPLPQMQTTFQPASVLPAGPSPFPQPPSALPLPQPTRQPPAALPLPQPTHQAPGSLPSPSAIHQPPGPATVGASLVRVQPGTVPALARGLPYNPQVGESSTRPPAFLGAQPPSVNRNFVLGKSALGSGVLGGSS